MTDVVIHAENLGKKYTIGHQTERNRYVALRDVLVNNARAFWRTTGDLLRGKPIIQGNDLEEVWALKDVNFEIRRGETVGIIGRNGAGKSTLLKVLSRITEPSAGRVTLKGRVASLLEVGTGFHPELTGRENVYLNGAILGMTRAEVKRKFDEIVNFSGIEKFLDTPVKRYSSGMYVRLAFAVAAHLEPEILMVDEVLAVGDTEFQKKCLGKMGSVAKEGRTVLFVSHQMAAIESFCDRTILLESGSILKDGPPPAVIAEYLELVYSIEPKRTELRTLLNRSGNGYVRIVSFHVENAQGKPVSAVKCGSDVTLVLACEAGEISAQPTDLDVGFYIFDYQTQRPVSVVYNSYQNITFSLSETYAEVRCTLVELPIPPGRYNVGARVTANGIEADRPRQSVGSFDVVVGDFYGTGKTGPTENVAVMLKGTWTFQEQRLARSMVLDR
jgi:lipopolysaccharide transport system ATP-binding protein